MPFRRLTEKKMNKTRIVFATANAGKLKEIHQILSDTGFEIISMAEAGVDIDIVEDGTTFEENALIKARAVAALLPGDIVMADDSGLEIDYLGGEPGIYSARYLGHDTSYHDKNMHFIKLLEGVPDEERTARFVCAIAAVLPGGREITTHGIYEGMIGYEEKGKNGFGYDPVFYLPDVGCYSAELTDEEKHARSHRGKALRAMRDEILKCEF